jgi:hypothetical protein
LTTTLLAITPHEVKAKQAVTSCRYKIKYAKITPNQFFSQNDQILTNFNINP